jgi:serine phosphatase RsbU (regulator of sigma subunit)
MRSAALYALLLLALCMRSQQKADSLGAALKTATSDTDKVRILIQLAGQFGSNDPEHGLKYCKQALEIVSNPHFDTSVIANKRFSGTAYRSKAVYQYFMGDYAGALQNLRVAIRIFNQTAFAEGAASAYGWLGNTYYSQGDFQHALDALLHALRLQETLQDQRGIAGALNGIANIYHRQHNLPKALEYYFKSLAVRSATHDSVNIAYAYNNIGLAYAEADSLAKALEYHQKCLQLVTAHNDKKGMANSYANIGEVYMKQAKYSEALSYLDKSLAISREISDRGGTGASHYTIGLVFSKMGDLQKALSAFGQSLAIAKEIGDLDASKDSHLELALTYKRMGNYPAALEAYEQYMHLKDSLMNEGNIRNLEEMQTRFETEKKEQEIQLLQKDQNIRELQISEQQANIKRQRILLYSALGGLLLVMALVFFIWKSYREKKKINTGLARKNVEINLQKKLIEEKNTLITDSIDYARNIQNAILPSHQAICAHLPESFILFQPKDIVSGDFYWMKTFDDERVLFAAVDCTGHGVPGAFMSVMAYNMLENIISEHPAAQPSQLLDELNRSVLETLRQDNENGTAKYGMDISLVCWHKRQQKIEFAGAHNPLLIVRADAAAGASRQPARAARAQASLTELKADKTTMGLARDKFTNHTFGAQAGDMLYIFTDGYADQKGGPHNKKFFGATLRNLLQEVSQLPCAEQHRVLAGTLADWKGPNEQIDDILVMGVRIA